MLHTYDILIVGAGPAGCAAAYDLAHAGKRVLLLDRRTFPRHKACACGLTRKTLKALRYSVDPIVERICHEIVLQNAAPDTEPDSRPTRRTEVRVKTRTPICAMAVRERFDDFCLNQTLAAGRKGGSATWLKIESLTAIRELPDHIELDITTADGPQTLTAPILIGADGSNGVTRRHVRQQRSNAGSPPSAQDSAQDDGFALEATVPFSALHERRSPSAQDHDLVFDFAPLPGGYGWLFPKGDHINIGVGAFAPSDGDHAESLKQVTRALLTTYCQQKLGITSLPDGKPFHVSGQHLGMGGHNYVPQGRVLLTGDAAGLVDPLTGEGIHSAIVSGQAAAAAILSCADGGSEGVAEANVAAAYAHHLAPLQQTLTFSYRAARAFYKEPERGFKAMRIPILRSLILKTYADGLPHTRLLTALAKLV